MTPTTPAPAEGTPAVRPGAPGWLRGTVDLARRFDDAPFSPSQVADRALSRLRERRRTSAQTNPLWAAIEERRGPAGAQFKTLLSDDLTWGDFRTQQRIEREQVPNPWWVPLAHAASDFKVRDLASATVALVDRARRGWDEGDVWNMSSRLPIHTGEQLAWLADHLTGWPGEHNGYPTAEDWEQTLRHHATVLTTLGYGNPHAADALLNAWAAANDMAADDPTPDNEARAEKTWTLMHDREDAARAVVDASMRWVADNLQLLWD